MNNKDTADLLRCLADSIERRQDAFMSADDRMRTVMLIDHVMHCMRNSVTQEAYENLKECIFAEFATKWWIKIKLDEANEIVNKINRSSKDQYEIKQK